MKSLIAIHGSHSQPEQMEAQRETWLKNLPDDAEYIFILGGGGGEVGDILFCGGPDGPLWERPGYRSWVGNRKTEALVKYALDNEYDYLFKCDDDTYVRAEMLLTSGFEEHDYVGFTDTHYTRELGWYRWAQGGAGYWLSRKAMGIVASNGLHVIPAEDFCVGNILAAHGIHPYHDERYNPNVTVGQLDSPEALESYITLHKVKAEAMYRLHSRVL